MTKIDPRDLSFADWDEHFFPRPTEQEFDRVVERAISRRGFLGGALAFGSGAAVMGTGILKGSTALAQIASLAKTQTVWSSSTRATRNCWS